MKFQNRSIHGSKVNRRTDRQTDRQTDKPKAICPSNFFKVGDFQILFSKGHNSEKGRNSDMKKNTGQLFFHEECAYEISKP